MAVVFALGTKNPQRVLNLRIIAAHADFDREGRALNVKVFEGDRDVVLAFDGGFPNDLISPILSVENTVSDNSAVGSSHVNSEIQIEQSKIDKIDKICP